MKIQYIQGNLFETDIKHIVHGCNAQGVMGSGVAAIIRRDYPEAYQSYTTRYKNRGLSLGEIQVIPSNGKAIINAITQDNFGGNARHANYEAIAVAMESINNIFYNLPNSKVAMPLIGAGLANGDWNVISAIIESELRTVQPVVYHIEPLENFL
jgi:O-acetyl-ADP-ribose deacetylase (regulator of RNase III)